MTKTDEWARQLHFVDGRRLASACSEEEMRHGLQGESSTLDRQVPLLTESRHHRLVFGEIRRSIPGSVSDKKHGFPWPELNSTGLQVYSFASRPKNIDILAANQFRGSHNCGLSG
jgi:hypothetical protein